MLAAILRGKAGRIVLGQETEPRSWREVFHRNEDLLTAVIFSRLRFLSQTGVEHVMAALLDEETARSLGMMKALEFWPNLFLTERSFVQPDLMITFERAVVVIEIKPPYGGVQSVAQWEEQIRALVHNFGRDREVPEEVYFIALGQNRMFTDNMLADALGPEFPVPVRAHCREWDVLIRGVDEWAGQGFPVDDAVWSDWDNAFELFGMSRERQRPLLDLVKLGSPDELLDALRLLHRFPKRQAHAPKADRQGSLPEWSGVVNLIEQRPLEAIEWN